MYLKSLSGKILYEGRFSSVKNGVEMAVSQGVDLSGVNLRCANLANASMDNAIMPGACFWGANLKNADFCKADISGSDMRTANLLDTCLAEASCQQVDFKGAYFSRTIVTGANLSACEFSCPSIFTVNLSEAENLSRALYYHLGEEICDLSQPPLVIHGLVKPFVFMKDKVLVGADLKEISLREIVFNFIQTHVTEKKLL